LAHIQQTTRPDNLPALSTKLAYQANRDGVAERVPEPGVPPSLEVDRARSNTDDHWLTDLERSLVKTTHAPEAPLFSRRRSLPRGGQSLALVWRDEIPAIHRCPRVQAFVSSGRLVTGATASAGNRQGTSGQKLGDADLTWAFSATAVLCLRHHPAGQQSLARLTKTQGQGNAWTVLAHQWARAVDDRWTRDTAVDRETCLQASWRGTGEPDASRDAQGIRLP